METFTRASAVAVAVVLAACGTDPPDPAIFPADYATTYQQVKSCRGSLEHKDKNIRVLASPDAVAPFKDRMAPFLPGAILVKEEYDFEDIACQGDINSITVMLKLDEGTAPTQLDWRWQRTDPAFVGQHADVGTCSDCHSRCGVPPNGYGGTCAQ